MAWRKDRFYLSWKEITWTQGSGDEGMSIKSFLVLEFLSGQTSDVKAFEVSPLPNAISGRGEQKWHDSRKVLLESFIGLLSGANSHTKGT